MKALIIAANGSSSRFGKDKLNSEFLGKSVLKHAVDAFFPFVDEIVIVSSDKTLSNQFPNAKIVAGGETRSKSIKNGLKALSSQVKTVAIHDGARPFVSKDLIQKLFEVAENFRSAVPVLPTTDTVFYAENLPKPTTFETLNAENTFNQDFSIQNSKTCQNSISSTQNFNTVELTSNQLKLMDRNQLFRVQTPQIFDFQRISIAYDSIDTEKNSFSDDSQVYLNYFRKITLVEGQLTNQKITYNNDLPTYKIGNGFDVHRMIEGDGVILGGVKIPFSKKLLGHSDADVLTHAIMDALLSASGNKDIGHFFPDTDMKYKNANSIDLLKEVLKVVQKCDFEISNVSATIIAEQPKLAPHIEKIASNLAKVLGIPTDCLNLTATTTENLGTTAEGNAIATSATCLLLKSN